MLLVISLGPHDALANASSPVNEGDNSRTVRRRLDAVEFERSVVGPHNAGVLVAVGQRLGVARRDAHESANHVQRRHDADDAPLGIDHRSGETPSPRSAWPPP